MITNKTKLMFFIVVISFCFLFRESNIVFLFYRAWESMLISMQKSTLSVITGSFQPETILTHEMQSLLREYIFYIMMFIFAISVIFNNQLNGTMQGLKEFFIGSQRSFLNQCTLNFKGGIISKAIQFFFFVIFFPIASSIHIGLSVYFLVIFIVPAKTGIFIGSKIPKISN